MAPTSTITVAILGLGRLGASVGLALKRYNADKSAKHLFQITGLEARGSAEKPDRSGIVDQVAYNPIDAVRNKDIVILTMPYSEVLTTYKLIGDSLRPGAVVMDFSPLKKPSIEWAQYLPETAFMVGATAIVNPRYLFDGLDAASHAAIDLFDKGAMLLTPAPRCPKDAVELVSDLSTILGATPHFMDADEHDGLIAATEGLPALLGAAVFYQLQEGRGWGDVQRMTNPAFGRLTHHLEDSHPDDLRDLLLNNRQNMLPVIDQLIASLQTFRTVLAENKRDALEVALIESATEYNAWVNRRRKGRWDDSGNASAKVSSNVMSTMMGGFLARRLKRGEKEE